jgi:transcriptional regulator with XRE-family HTH domain
LEYDPFPEPESFPGKIKTYRLRPGLSQKRMAEKLGVDPGTIGYWELGKHKATKESQKPINSLLKNQV